MKDHALTPLRRWQQSGLVIAGGFLLWWWFLFVLASAGRFSFFWVLTSLLGALLMSAGLVYYGYQLSVPYIYNKESLSEDSEEASPSRTMRLAILLCVFLLAAFFVVVFSPLLAHPTVFSGRDQGSYSLAAIQLAHTGHLAFTSESSQAFFKLYGAGKALNFPGFAYTDTGALVTQFPLGSILWYAGFVSLFGLAGFFLANVLTAFFSTLLFFRLVRAFSSLRWSLWGAFFFAASFPIVWFGRYTLSENAALPLFLLLSVQTMVFLRKPTPLPLFLSLGVALMLAITRIEGWAILVMLGILLFGVKNSRQWIATHISQPILFLVFTVLLLVALWDGVANLAFFRSLASMVWHHWLQPLSIVSSASQISLFSSVFFLWQIFWLYSLAPIFLVGGLSVFVVLRSRRFLALTPLFLALPTIFYLMSPQITADHPWMLRRFVFTLWPTFLFLALVGIAFLGTFLRETYPRRRIVLWFAPVLAVSLTLSTLTVTWYALPIVENSSLLAQTAALANRFSDRDLILVDRLASGDPFTLLAGPLQSVYGRQAVYSFNPNDVSKLDTSAFDHVYVVVGHSEVSAYREALPGKLFLRDLYTIENAHLEPEKSADYPTFISQRTLGLILEYQRP